MKIETTVLCPDINDKMPISFDDVALDAGLVRIELGNDKSKTYDIAYQDLIAIAAAMEIKYEA